MIDTPTTPNLSISPLLALLEGDEITLPGRGEERQIKCFNPHHHDDDTPSMRVNVVKEVYHCHGCDIRGNAWSYLTEIRGYSPQNATVMLKGMGWTPETLRHAQDFVKQIEEASSGTAEWVDRPYEIVGGKNGTLRRDKQDETAASIRMRRGRSAARNGGRA